MPLVQRCFSLHDAAVRSPRLQGAMERAQRSWRNNVTSGKLLSECDAAARDPRYHGKTRLLARKAANAAGILQAYSMNPNSSLQGLAREAIGLEDGKIEYEKILIAAKYIQSMIGDRKIEAVITLGSGLGGLAEQIEDPIVIPYADIPCFPHPGNEIKGHAGNLVVGKLNGRMVAAMSGRFHLYQGITAKDAARPVRTLIHMGARTFIVTNAAGAVNTDFDPGDIMIITDHLNLTGQSPLTGDNIDQFGARFPDMSKPYSQRLRELVEAIASEQVDHVAMEDQGTQEIIYTIDRIRRGIYAQVTGPEYETPEIVRKVRKEGGDAVGMSTVIEVIAANHFNSLDQEAPPRVEIIGLTLITNPAAGSKGAETLKHEEVEEEAERAKRTFVPLVAEIVGRLAA